jgi:hypothetical protein
LWRWRVSLGDPDLSGQQLPQRFDILFRVSGMADAAAVGELQLVRAIASDPGKCAVDVQPAPVEAW